MTTRLPPMKISRGEPFAYDVTVTGQDWTGYTGTATFKSRFKSAGSATGAAFDGSGDYIIQVTATGDAAGLIQFDLTASETALLRALPRLGPMYTTICEISMTDGTDVQKFQATVSVAASI
jgi:hypothetical protein